MAGKIDRMWVNKEIRDYNELGGRTRDQESGMEVEIGRLANAILSHLNFDRGVQSERQRLMKGLLQHLDASRDEVDGSINTDANEIWDLLSAPAPERKTLKLSGNMRTLDIDRATGETIAPSDVVETLLSEDENNALQQLGLECERFFNENGVKCSYEYPGYQSCPNKLGTLDIGTADGFWGASMTDETGGTINLPDELQDTFGQFADADPLKIPPESLLTAAKIVLDWANA